MLINTAARNLSALCFRNHCLILVVIFMHCFISANAQFKSVSKGERPPIELESISEDAYENGIIRVKFDKSKEPDIDKFVIRKDENGILLFDLPEIDALNAVFGVKDAKKTFEVQALKNRYSQRHRKWGFHLWFDLRVSDDTDLIAMIKAYNEVKAIEIAELRFKKELIGFEKMEEDYIFSDSGISIRNENGQLIPDDPRFEDQWHYHNTGQNGGTSGADINLPQAWNFETGKEDIIVAVIDHGINAEHPDLVGNMWENHGYNFVNNTENVNPGNHGTHVAGTIAAMNHNNLGVSGIAGGWGESGGVKLMSCQVFESGSFAPSGGFEIAPVWAADNGAVISQNSWGYTSAYYYEHAVLDAIDYFNVNGGGNVLEGGLTIYASGNSNVDGPYYPGYYSGAMAVAGTNNHDQKSPYSNYGDFIEISAPGGDTSESFRGGVLSTTVNGYSFNQGTSMACPHVSGVAALMVSMAPAEFTAQQIRDMLKVSSDDHYDVNPGYEGKLGKGRLNAFNSLVMISEHMTGVPNPLAFSGSVDNGYRSILSWESNTDNDPVIIAVSDSKEFGRPAEDMVVGDTIPGGGLIIYIGKGDFFIHDFADNPRQTDYKLWAKQKESGIASYGRHIKLQTQEISEVLPMYESFLKDSKPSGWDVIQTHAGLQDTGLDPELTFVSQGSNPQAIPSQGSHMVKFNSAHASKDASALFISPALSSKGLPYVMVVFDWYHDENFSQVNDRVHIQASLNKTSWTTISTINRFNPEGGWHQKTAYLPSQFYNKDSFYVAFRFESHQSEGDKGGNMYLDNLGISSQDSLLFPDFMVSTTQAVSGQTIVVSNKTAGEPIESLQWDFGPDAFPQHASGSGPHRFHYLEPGSKNISLIVNDSIEVNKHDLIQVSQNPLQPPLNLTASVINSSEVFLQWEAPGMDKQNSKEENFLKGYNIYRNGIFINSISSDSISAFTDNNVPLGWLKYEVSAYYNQPHKESIPAGPVITAVNQTKFIVAVEGEGDTNPEPGEYLLLENDTVQIEAIPQLDNIFMHWVIGDSLQVEDKYLEIIVSEDINVVAVFQSTVNVPEYMTDRNKVSIFPNPAQSEITLNFSGNGEPVLIQIFAITGELVKQVNFFEGVINQKFKVDSLKNGIYLVRLIQEGYTKTTKLIINRQK